MELSTHQKRLLTAILLPLPLIATLILGGWVVFGVLLCFCLLGLWEFYAMFWPGAHNLRLKLTGLAVTPILLLSFTWTPIWPLLILLAAFWAGNLGFLFSFSAKGQGAAYGDSLVYFAGILYVPLTMHFFLLLPPVGIILVLVAPIASDTAAFYTGTYLGKGKIWPSVSPKKTWRGSLAGLGACVLVTVVLGLIFGEALWWGWVLLGLGLGVAAQMGDFFESALKRKLDIKDSGHILPGHGGLLDRMDSLLFVLPSYGLAVAAFPSLALEHGFDQVFARLATF